MRKIFGKIKDSYFRSLRGEENFWVVLLGWGVGVYAVASLSTLCLIWLLDKSGLRLAEKLTTDIIVGAPISVFGPLGLFFVFVYPLLFSYSLLRISYKKSLHHLISSILILIAFLYLHFFTSKIVIVGSIFLVMISPVGWLVGFVIIILIAKNTVKFLKKPR